MLVSQVVVQTGLVGKHTSTVRAAVGLDVVVHVDVVFIQLPDVEALAAHPTSVAHLVQVDAVLVTAQPADRGEESITVFTAQRLGVVGGPVAGGQCGQGGAAYCCWTGWRQSCWTDGLAAHGPTMQAWYSHVAQR